MKKYTQALGETVLDLSKTVNSSELQELAHRYLKGEHSEIANATVPDPGTCDATSMTLGGFTNAYLSYNLLRKAPFLELDENPEENCRKAWFDVEKHNKSVNQRRSTFISNVSNNIIDDPSYFSNLGGDVVGANPEDDVYFPALLRRIRYYVDQILGPCDIEQALKLGTFSSGASDDLPRNSSGAANKYMYGPTVTAEARDLAAEVILKSPLWSTFVDPDHLKVVRGDLFSTVAKDAKTDRSISLQPRMNLYIQKGVGQLIRKRLTQFYQNFYGLQFDLNRSWEQNKGLAQIGSIFGTYATVDGREASNRWTRYWVRQLLPIEWYEFLDKVAVKQTFIKHIGKDRPQWTKTEMFMAMGNGFTFELQTVLFLAIGLAATARMGHDTSKVLCFGDDLIVPTIAYPLVVEIYDHMGHAVNLKKSYHSGPFRESCGGDYFNGQDVSGFTLGSKTSPDSIDTWYFLRNNLLAWLSKHPSRTKSTELSYISFIRTLDMRIAHLFGTSKITRRGTVKVPKRRTYVTIDDAPNCGLWSVAHNRFDYSKQSFRKVMLRARPNLFTPKWVAKDGSLDYKKTSAYSFRTGECIGMSWLAEVLNDLELTPRELVTHTFLMLDHLLGDWCIVKEPVSGPAGMFPAKGDILFTPELETGRLLNWLNKPVIEFQPWADGMIDVSHIEDVSYTNRWTNPPSGHLLFLI